VLEASLVRALDDLARERNATLFMVLLVAYQVLVARLAGQSDVAVGAPVARRDRPEVEGTVGLFVNTVVLRARLGDDPRFDEHLARVRATTLEAYAHQDAPFEQVVEAIGGARDTSRSPLFQTLFA